ncbi:hypothetical protein [Variovorax davisae]|uniref:hypothetical protein n=1 Tax=Variovorax davisae TaxID=3053515 RepID=UPI002576B3AB|nr:hypothetical protein [Variovorax sp. J22P271]
MLVSLGHEVDTLAGGSARGREACACTTRGAHALRNEFLAVMSHEFKKVNFSALLTLRDEGLYLPLKSRTPTAN